MFFTVYFNKLTNTMMTSQEISTRQNTKRKRVTSIEAVPTSDPPPQPHRGEKKSPHLHNRPSSKFWDNLSHIWLTRSALREFDRRAAQLVISTPKYPSDLNGYPVRDLERFARRGGPSLGDLGGVGTSSQSQGTRAFGVSLDPLQKKKLITAYDKNFEQCLIDSGIPPCGGGPDPENWHELNIRLARRRPSLLQQP